MSGSVTYVVDENGTLLPLERASLYVTGSTPAYYFSALGEPGVTLPAGTTLTIDEEVGGTVVGSATLSGITNQYSAPDGPNQTVIVGDAATADFTGRFDLAPCFAAGTLIATPDGDVPVEALTAGTPVRLATGGTAPVVWTGHRRQADAETVRIRAHALGHGRPARDLVVSADHGIFLDGVLVQAALLANGDTILAERRPEITFWHVELASHAILLAENAPAETYLDTGNRHRFGNCPLSYDQRDAARHEPCAEMVFAGERLDRIRAALPVPA